MLIGGIYFEEKTIWDEISENIKATEMEMDKALDRLKGEMQEDKEPDEVDVLVESLLNYKDVLEGKVRDLEQENEKLHAEIERQDEEIERLQNENDSKAWKIELLRHNIKTLRTRCREEARDLFDREMWGLLKICRADENGRDAMYNQLLKNTEGEARELFTRHLFYNLKCVPVNQKCDCGNFKKQIEELQAEVRDLTAENVTLGREKANLLGVCAKNGAKLQKNENEYRELKEKYETADLEREHIAKELDRLRELVKELNERHQQDCIDLKKKQTTINEIADSCSELRRMKGLSE